jgi:hypothetical protein
MGKRYCTQFIEPPYTERYARWCGRTAVQLMGSLLPDSIDRFEIVKRFKTQFYIDRIPDVVKHVTGFFICHGAFFKGVLADNA